MEFEAVSLDLVLRAVEGASNFRLIILDACRDNPFAVAMRRAGGTRSIGRGLASVEPPGETLVAYAAKEGTVAADGEGRNSPYTTALLTHLEEPGLDVGLMFRKVRDAVLAKTGGHQEPFWYGSLSSEGAYLAALPEPEPEEPASAPETVTVTGGEDPKTPDPNQVVEQRIAAEKELLFWESVKDSTHAADFEAYLEQFPGGTYETLARNRLARLATDPQDEKPDVQVAVTPDEPERVIGPELPTPAPETVEALLGLERDERRKIQMGLASLGFDPGPADGLFGRRTRTAIEDWQSSQGGSATGHLDAEAAKLLLAAGEEEARKRGAEDEERKRAEEEAARKREAMRPGRVFRDCPECPEMVVVPAGSFTMGSPSWEEGRDDDEGPQRRVTIDAPFAVGKYEITRKEFNQFVDATGYSAGDQCWVIQDKDFKEREGRNWRNPGYHQSARHPVVCVSWNDAQAYVSWISQTTGEQYRLLSESEWEYAARAGTSTSRYWGDEASEACNHENVADVSFREKYTEWTDPSHDCDDGHLYTSPVGTHLPNKFGLFDMLGNVGELVEDCWNDTYTDAPIDSRTWIAGDCSKRGLRASSWSMPPMVVRSARRSAAELDIRFANDGFRIAKSFLSTLSPFQVKRD